LPHFRPLLESDFEAIYPIEQAAHQEPWRGQPALLLRAALSQRPDAGGRTTGRFLHLGSGGGRQLPDESACIPIFRARAGAALLREYLARSKAGKAEAWFPEVRAGNRTAINLYESEGFAEYCRRADYYGTGQEREDAVLMSRLFDLADNPQQTAVSGRPL
jgi:ribosomal-protein-alanine N-acetyltransferase